MAKKIRIVLTLQLPAGKATPAPPVGTALGPHGINIVEFTKSYNEKTADKSGQIIPAQITIFEDRSFSFILKTPPAADLLRKAAGVEKGARHRQARDRRARHQRPGPRDRRRSRWPTSTPTTSRPPPARSRARPGAWASRSSTRRSARQPRATGRADQPDAHPAQGGGRVRPTARRSHMAHGKKYIEAAKLVERGRVYEPGEAVELVKQTTTVSFDATVEAHLRLGVDPRHADQLVRGTVVLPHGTGKVVRVAVFATGEKAQEALRAGADEVGGDDLVKKIEAGWLEFDVALATPDSMGLVGKLGKILGRRGLMPNPKAGHHHLRPRARDQGGQGRPRRVQGRQGRHRPRRRRSSSFEATRCSRTSRPWSTRSTAPSPRAPRASTSRPSRSPARWARASGSTCRASWPRPRPDPRPAGRRPTRRDDGREAGHLTRQDGPPQTACARGPPTTRRSSTVGA